MSAEGGVVRAVRSWQAQQPGEMTLTMPAVVVCLALVSCSRYAT
jgi:hypothetical protein